MSDDLNADECDGAELRNWSTMYQQTCNGLGQSLKHVQQRAQGDVGRVLQPLLNELMNAKAKVRRRR